MPDLPIFLNYNLIFPPCSFKANAVFVKDWASTRLKIRKNSCYYPRACVDCLDPFLFLISCWIEWMEVQGSKEAIYSTPLSSWQSLSWLQLATSHYPYIACTYVRVRTRLRSNSQTTIIGVIFFSLGSDIATSSQLRPFETCLLGIFLSFQYIHFQFALKLSLCLF